MNTQWSRTVTVLVSVTFALSWLSSAARGASASETQQKLRALEAAHQAGILSDQEYAQKKAALRAQLGPQLDEATRRKLAALDAALQAGILNQEEYQRKKAALVRGATAARPATPVAPAAVPQRRPAKKGSTFRHPIGFSCWYPQGWRIQEQGEALQFIPSNADMQRELYLLIGDSVAGEGITQPGHPMVVQYLDQQIKSLSYVLQYTERPMPVPMSSGQGVLLEWQAQGAQGQAVRARAYTCILRDFGVALIAFGMKDKLDARDGELRRMFASFGFGEGQKDPQIVGSWQLVSSSAVRNNSPFETAWSRAKMASESKSQIVFQTNGTWSRTDVSRTLAGAGGLWIDTGPQKSAQQGRWNAGGGVLYMMWQDGSWEEYKYQVRRTAQGRELRLVCDGRGEVWQER